MNSSKTYLILLVVLSGCNVYRGNVSTGGAIDCPLSYTATGTAKTNPFTGVSGNDKDALILKAKRNLLEQNPYKKGVYLSNYSVDFKDTYFLIFHTTKVTVSADVFNCNRNINDTIFEKETSNLNLSIINGFRLGDSLLYCDPYKPDQFVPSILISHSSDSRVKISFKKGRSVKVRLVLYSEVFKITKDPKNSIFFEFEIGDEGEIKVYNSTNKSLTVKKCRIIGLNKLNAIVDYTSDDGTLKRTIVAKQLIRK